MANTITLRAYLDELEHLLDARSPTEVISHCRYILQHYPRNVEAYRLLGRALLERGERDGVAEHYDEALEMFQRVLSVLPNDYVAHLGVSQVFQEKGELERAIWHLERAYEQMPSNQTLQEALRELYAQRGDAEAPARLQLTRGALVHQYIRAQQYEQALVELRAALAEAQDERLDLQALLAEVLWEVGHTEEAAEQAARILETLPNCLAANRILARYWLAHERPSDAQVFLERIEAVDPYEARRTLQPEADAPDPNTLERLDYGTQAQVTTSSETPDWVEELGDLSAFAAEQSGPFSTEPEPSAAPLDTEALFGASFQVETPADEPPSDWPTEDSAPSPPPFEAELWPDSAPSPPVADATEAPGTPFEPSDGWLAETDMPPASAELAAADDAPLPPDWLEGDASDDDAPLPPDWLDEPEETPQEPPAPLEDWTAEAAEEAPEPPSAEPSPAQPEESAPLGLGAVDDEATWLFSLDEAEETPTEAQPEEPPPTGFTGLLEEIQTQRAVEETLWGADEDAEPEPEPPDWLASYVETGEAEASAAPTEAEAESAADLFHLFEETEAEESVDAATGTSAAADTETPAAAPQAADAPSAPLETPEWLVEPEYDFFAPSEPAPAQPSSSEVSELAAAAPQAADDWLETLEEADESALSDVPLGAEEAWQAAEEQAAGLDWLSEATDSLPADEDAIDALFAEREEDAQAQGLPTSSSEAETEPAAAAPADEDWLATLPTDEETVLMAAEEDAELTLSEGEAAVRSVLDTLEADVPKLEPSVDEPLAFEAVEDSLFGPEAPEETAGEEPPSPTSALEERVAQMAEESDSPSWLAGLEADTADKAEPAPSDDEQTIYYRAAGQTGILQPDEAPSWMAAFTGEAVPEEPEPEAEEDALETPEAAVAPSVEETPPEADAFSTRLLQTDSPPPTEAFDLFDEEQTPVADEEAPLDTDELFADVLGELPDTAEVAEPSEEGELPAWLQAITQSEAEKLDESLLEAVEPYSSSAEDSGVLQPTEEDEWLQGLGEEQESAAAFSTEPSTDVEAEALLDFLGLEAEGDEPTAEAVPPVSATAEAEPDETLLEFLDVDAAAIAEMDFEDIAAELEQAAHSAAESAPEASAEAGAPPEVAVEERGVDAVAEAPDLPHTMAEDAHTLAAHGAGETSEVSAAPEDDFSFEGVVPRWLRRPKEHVPDEVTTDNSAPPSPPEWLRDVSEELEQPDQDDVQ